MKASETRIKAALDRPPADIRLYLLYGPDESGAMALAARLGRAMGPEAERVDFDGAALKADSARLADEAASLSLFGGARYIRVTGAGDESTAAVEALLSAERAGNPVVMVAPSLKATSRLVKRALEADTALATACYAPVGEGADALAAQLAREHGLRMVGGVARRLVQAAGGDRAVMARELEKLALYLDAGPDRPQQLDDAALDAVGADLGEAEMSEIVEGVVAGRTAELGAALRRMNEANGSPIPWLRQLARRLGALAEMRADVAAGGDIASVIKRHRVFFREEAATAAALRRWTPEALVEAQRRVRRIERSLVASGTAGTVLADQAMLGMAERVRRQDRR
ncbi:MAG: DNA polymerase III subunit delta [Candidatus Sphingomonas colombiensis]|nr:DNA polymerase III subunit delta [Sphingomonas sp.]WEK44519.1 MAG: DNA polymerase III subunit delta [Sphingomonas sp.]